MKNKSIIHILDNIIKSNLKLKANSKNKDFSMETNRVAGFSHSISIRSFGGSNYLVKTVTKIRSNRKFFNFTGLPPSELSNCLISLFAEIINTHTQSMWGIN